MKSSKKNIKNKAASSLISEIWNVAADKSAINKIEKYLKSHPETLEKLKYDDPASVLFLLGSETRHALDTERLELKARLIDKNTGIKQVEKNQSRSIFPILFGRKWRFAAVGAVLIMFCGIILITKPELFSLRPQQNSGAVVNSSEDMKKNTGYDKDVFQETATTCQNIDDSQASNSGVKSITSNLVADGEKVIHYTTETGAEVIFITGLN